MYQVLGPAQGLKSHFLSFFILFIIIIIIIFNKGSNTVRRYMDDLDDEQEGGSKIKCV